MRKPKKPNPPRKAAASPAAGATAAPDDQIISSNLSLHELFQIQTRTLLDSADLSEEQKQNVLIALSCPCCGAGGMSFTAKLKKGR
jgi:hypothetical protein